MRFARAIVQQPNTNASHASIFTGLYPKTHGVRLHLQDRLSPRIPTLARVLHDQGFHTTGPFSWVRFEAAFSGLDQGFDEYQSFVTNRPVTRADPRLEYLAATYRRLVDHLSVLQTSDAALHLRGDVEEELDGRADITIEAALRWVDNRPSEPFFLWLHYGESLADDGNWLHPANLYFTETRVPPIVRYPPRIAPNQVIEGPVQLGLVAALLTRALILWIWVALGLTLFAFDHLGSTLAVGQNLVHR